MKKWLNTPLLKGSSITYKRFLTTTIAVVGSYYGMATIRHIPHIKATLTNIISAILLCTFISYSAAFIEVLWNQEA